jgi:hypothetical protein
MGRVISDPLRLLFFRMAFYLRPFAIQSLERGDDIAQTKRLLQFLHYILRALFLQIITVTNKGT